jgi:RHS repeat-associated protein
VAYQWDAMNNLVKITYPDGGWTEIRRDLAGRPQRFVEYDSGGVMMGSPRNFHWDGARRAAEYSLTLEDGPDFTEPIRRFFPGGELVFDPNYFVYDAYFYIRDHLGSVRAVADEDGEVVARYDYDPYGKRRLAWHSGVLDPLTYLPIEFDFGFTGHLFHGRSGLYFAPLRAYDPELGRWLSRDPIDMAGGINLYEYVGGDPVNAVDVWGLSSKWLDDNHRLDPGIKKNDVDVPDPYNPDHWTERPHIQHKRTNEKYFPGDVPNKCPKNVRDAAERSWDREREKSKTDEERKKNLPKPRPPIPDNLKPKKPKRPPVNMLPFELPNWTPDPFLPPIHPPVEFPKFPDMPFKDD